MGATNFTGPYFWMSLSLNITMTIAICARLLFYRRRITRILGPNHGTQYTSVAAMIVESASLYSAFALLFLIPFALGNPIQNTFIQLIGEIQVSIAVSTTVKSEGCQYGFISRSSLPSSSLTVWRTVPLGPLKLHKLFWPPQTTANMQELKSKSNSQVLTKRCRVVPK